MGQTPKLASWSPGLVQVLIVSLPRTVAKSRPAVEVSGHSSEGSLSRDPLLPSLHLPHAISQTCTHHFPHPVCYFSPPSPHTCNALSLDHPPSCLPPPTDASKPSLKVISSTKPSLDSGSPYSSAHCVMYGLLLLAQCTVSSCPPNQSPE